MFENYPSLETKNNKVLENEKKGKKTFRNCMLKKLNGDLMSKLHFVGFFCVNNDKEIDCNNPQMMCCIFPYN